MAPDAVREAIVGRAVQGIYPDGRVWSEMLAADGRTALNEAGMPNTGRWSFDRNEQLCFLYERGHTIGACFRYVAIGPNCYEHFFQIRSGDDKSGWLSNGRLWRTAEPSTCAEKPTS